MARESPIYVKELSTVPFGRKLKGRYKRLNRFALTCYLSRAGFNTINDYNDIYNYFAKYRQKSSGPPQKMIGGNEN